MADKEATIYVVDVGKPTGLMRHGRDKTDLDWSMEYVWDKIAATVRTAHAIKNEVPKNFKRLLQDESRPT